VEATCHLCCRERVQLVEGEGGEVAWGGAIIPQNIAHVNAHGKAVGKACVAKAKLQHLVLEFFTGHSGGITVDDAKVRCGDFLDGGVTVGRCCVEHKVSTGGMPFLHLVLLLCVLLLDMIELLALDFVLVLGLLDGAGDASSKGPEDVGGVRHGGGDGAHGLKARQDVIVVEAGIPLCKFSVVWGDGETCLLDLDLVDSNAPKIE
jgi:hypothetical protein